MKRTKDMNREERTLYWLARYAEAIKAGEGVQLAACNAHFAIKMYTKKEEQEK